jgi:group I intron endonuclease
MIIYKTTNLINGKIYIGQTNGNRKNYIGGGKILKTAIKKYGKENFKFEIIVKGDFNRTLVDDLEIHYIRLYNSTNKNIGYNLENGGFGHPGKKLSKKHKLKISKANKGKKKKPFSEEHKLKISISKKGIKQKTTRSKQAIENFKKSRCGKPLTEEHKKALSMARLKYLAKQKPKK